MHKYVALPYLLLSLGCSQTALSSSYLMSTTAFLPQYNGTMKDGGVAFYGTMDIGINYQSAAGQGAWQMQSGGEWTSKLGMYGREHLGNGWRTEFNLEAGFLPNEGKQQDPNRLFNREAWIGLASDQYGQFRLGRQLSTGLPLFIDAFGSIGSNSVYTWLGAGAVQTPKGLRLNGDLGPGSTQVDARVDNALKWISPRYKGVGLEVTHVAAEKADRPVFANRGVAASYFSGPHFLVASYNRVWQPLPGKDAGIVHNDFYGLAAIHDVGDLVLSASYNLNIPRRAENGIARVYAMGAIIPYQRHTYRISGVYRDTSGAVNARGEAISSSALGLMLGYDYNLSKRTALYTRAGGIRNYHGSTIVLNNHLLPLDAAGNPTPGSTATGFSVGMYHHF